MIQELAFVRTMFDRIAPRYDFLNRLLSLGQDRIWRSRMVRSAGLTGQARVLDVACGTCDVGLAVHDYLRGKVRVTGLDFSHGMLNLARAKLDRCRNRTIRLTTGDALTLPFRNHQFDTVFIAFGIRNIMDRQRALAEFHRVLVPGGHLGILELTTPTHPLMRRIYLMYFQHILPRIGALFSRHAHAYTYLPASVLQFPSAHAFARRIRSAGFSEVRSRPMTFGIVTLFSATRSEYHRIS